MKVILWDWDNTLMDSFGAIFYAQNATRQYFGLAPWNKEECRFSMNKSGQVLFSEWAGPENIQHAKEIYLKFYHKFSNKIRLKSGAKEILNQTKALGYINILASNKSGELLRNEVTQKHLNPLFDRIVGSTDAPQDKPHKAFTDFALKGLKYDSLYVVGDSWADIQMARNYAHATAFLVSKAPQKDLTPDFYCQSLKEVAHILLASKQILGYKRIKKRN